MGQRIAWRPLLFRLLLVTVLALPAAADEVFKLEETSISIPQADYQDAMYYDDIGYPHIDWNRYDRKHHAVVEREHRAVGLENRYVKVTVLPRIGRIYSFVFKPTGHEEFWINKIAKPLGALNDTGWWMIWGGVENTLPGGEHGVTWALPWEYRILEDSEDRKAVRMTIQEPKTKLIEDIDVAIYPDRSYYEMRVRLANPTSEDVRYARWINPMWAPGGAGEITANTEFIVPAESLVVADKKFNAWMGEKRQPYARNPLRFVKNWKNIGDLMFTDLTAGFYSAYSHDAEEGIVRVFDEKVTPGVDIWTWGYPPTEARQQAYSDVLPNMGYVEIWGGVARGYAEEDKVILKAGATLEWTEWMYAYQGTGGLVYANERLAIYFAKDPERGTLDLGLCPTAALDAVEWRISSSDSTLFEDRVDIRPGAPYRCVLRPASPESTFRLVVTHRGEVLAECMAR